MFKHFGRLLASIVVMATLSAGAAAQTFNESGDAGQTLATAQAVPGGTTTILGNLQTEGDVDLYRFTLAAAGSITIRAWGEDQEEGCRYPDANLILFNGSGLPLWGDDDGYDDTMCYGSEIVLNLPAGTYYLAFGDNNTEAYDADDTLICSNDDDDCSSVTTPMAYMEGGSTTGPYTITFSRATGGTGSSGTVAAVPGPTGLLLLPLLAVVGLAGSRTLRRRA